MAVHQQRIIVGEFVAHDFEAPVWLNNAPGGIINPPRPVMTDATTLILLPLSGVQPTWRNMPLAAAARSLAVEPVTLAVRSDREIETAISALGGEQAGLVLMDDAFMAVHYPAVISSTLANKVPSIFAEQGFARDGGLRHMGRILRISFDAPPATSIAS